MTTKNDDKRAEYYTSRDAPPGKIKIANALLSLLEEKEFNAITTAEIARVSGVNEALIYRYFQDKRGLLHGVLEKFIEEFMFQIEGDLREAQGGAEKLRKLVQRSLEYYNRNRVCAKILLLEVRNFPGYFESPTYNLARSYARLLLDIIEEGIRVGEFRDDLPPRDIMQILLGATEHLLLPGIIFDKTLDTDASAKSLCEIIFDGIGKR